MPMPRTARQKSSWMTLCDVAAPSEANEKISDRAHQGARAAEAIGDVAEDEPPTPDMTSVTVPSMPAVCVVELEVAAQLPDRHGVEHEVHGVEHPAELRRQEDAPLLARDRAVPGHFRPDGGRRTSAARTSMNLNPPLSVGSRR